MVDFSTTYMGLSLKNPLVASASPLSEKVESAKKLEEAGFNVISMELYMKPKTYQVITDSDQAKKALAFLDSLHEHDDVQKVFTNLDIPNQ